MELIEQARALGIDVPEDVTEDQLLGMILDVMDPDGDAIGQMMGENR